MLLFVDDVLSVMLTRFRVFVMITYLIPELIVYSLDVNFLVGKFIVCYVPACGEKEYYLGCACEELYAPPSAYFSLYGLSVQAQFLGGEQIFLPCFS